MPATALKTLALACLVALAAWVAYNPTIGGGSVSANHVLVCQPRHIDRQGNDVPPDAESKAQYDRLASRLLGQADHNQGNLYRAVLNTIHADRYPVVFLPRLQDGGKTTDVVVTGAAHPEGQRCGGRAFIEYEAVPRMKIPIR